MSVCDFGSYFLTGSKYPVIRLLGCRKIPFFYPKKTIIFFQQKVKRRKLRTVFWFAQKRVHKSNRKIYVTASANEVDFVEYLTVLLHFVVVLGFFFSCEEVNRDLFFRHSLCRCSRCSYLLFLVSFHST